MVYSREKLIPYQNLAYERSAPEYNDPHVSQFTPNPDKICDLTDLTVVDTKLIVDHVTWAKGERVDDKELKLQSLSIINDSDISVLEHLFTEGEALRQQDTAINIDDSILDQNIVTLESGDIINYNMGQNCHKISYSLL